MPLDLLYSTYAASYAKFHAVHFSYFGIGFHNTWVIRRLYCIPLRQVVVLVPVSAVYCYPVAYILKKFFN